MRSFTSHSSAVAEHWCTANQHCIVSCALPLHQCCSATKAENSLFCLCTSAALQQKLKTAFSVFAITPMRFCTSHSSALAQHWCTANQHCMVFCALPLHQCCSATKAENSLFCLCNHTHEVFLFTQLCCGPTLVFSMSTLHSLVHCL